MKLSKPQKQIADLERFAGGSICNICGSMLLDEVHTPEELIFAAKEVLRINEALRMRVDLSSGEQYVCDYDDSDIPLISFNSKTELEDYCSKLARTPFDLGGSLCDIKPFVLGGRCGLICMIHHLIGDAWTTSLICNQFREILSGNTPEAYPYSEYLETEERYVNSARYEKDRVFFEKGFEQCGELTFLCERQPKSFDARRKTFILGSDEKKKITDFANGQGVSVSAVMMSALCVYFGRIKMNAESFCIGTAVLNRNGGREKNTMGLFINTVPVFIGLDNEKSFSDNIKSVFSSSLAVLRHQRFDYADTLSAIRSRFGFTGRLFDVLFSYQNSVVTGEGSESVWYHCGMQTESLQMHIDDRDNEGILKINYDYSSELFSDDEISGLHNHIMCILADGIGNSSKAISELDIMTDDEKEHIINGLNSTYAAIPADICVHTLFEEKASEDPDRTAVIACDRTLTYRELNEDANRIAHGLIEKGIGTGDIVAFSLQRKSRLIAAMLGILKSGAAYLPIDPDYPEAGTEYILSDSKAAYFITEKNIDEIICPYMTDNPSVEVSSESPCYCIYTSGSTGTPKGVVLRHRNVINYISNNDKNIIQSIKNEECRTVVSVTTAVLDIFVTESLLPLANGMTTVLADEEQSATQSRLNSLLKAHPADVMQATPTKMKMLISDGTQTDYLKTLKVIILGGEALDEKLIKDLKKLTDAEIINNIPGEMLNTDTLLRNIRPCENSTLYSVLNGKNVPLDETVTVYSLFAKYASENSEKVCITDENGDITFGSFIKTVERLDAEIRKTVGAGKQIIGVYTQRSPEMYASVYAIIRGGNAYMPIDVNQPAARTEYMISDSGASLVLGQGKYRSQITNARFLDVTAFLADEKTDTEIPDPCSLPDDTAYVIYTSGTTGNPKGAMISNISAVNRIRWMHRAYPTDDDSVILQKTPYTFDVSVWELFWWGMYGGKLAYSAPDEHFLPEKICEKIVKHSVTHIHFVPSVFSVFLEYIENGGISAEKLGSLKHIFLSGEALTASLVKKFFTIFGHGTHIGLHNLYGPTECAVDVTYYDCTDEDISVIPIGRPIDNTSIYITDKYLNTVPVGCMGEICIGGVNVGKGYVNNPDLTKKVFVCEDRLSDRIYRTGDIGYIDRNGEIIFCGRRDTQIKINGQRIETEEIESVISSVKGITAAAVLPDGSSSLKAFYSGTEYNGEEISRHCAEHLPRYMIPSSFTHIDRIPVNRNGKADKKALASYTVEQSDKNTVIEPPVNRIEEEICGKFSQLLKIEKVGRNTDFISSGGSSIDIISFVSDSRFSSVSVSEFISSPTPAGIASILSSRQSEKQFKYISRLRKSENSRRAVVVFPFAGGTASSFGKFAQEICRNTDASVYFADFPKNEEDIRLIEEDIISLSSVSDTVLYSHCIGTYTALYTVGSEAVHGRVKAIVAGGFIPPASNSVSPWKYAPDGLISYITSRAGGKLSLLNPDMKKQFIADFRRDALFTSEYMKNFRSTASVPVYVILADKDIYTRKLRDVRRAYSPYAGNIVSVDIFSSGNHYFQNEKTELISEKINSAFIEK